MAFGSNMWCRYSNKTFTSMTQKLFVVNIFVTSHHGLKSQEKTSTCETLSDFRMTWRIKVDSYRRKVLKSLVFSSNDAPPPTDVVERCRCPVMY